MHYIKNEDKTYLRLQSEYSIGSLLAKVLASFNYSSDDMVFFFCEKKEIDTSFPVLKQIADRLYDIRNRKLKVFVYGDYDVDGISATAIMVKILNSLQIQNGYYIPNRLTEGYGLNMGRLSQAIEKGYDVLITVDNGVSAFEQLDYANEKGMQVIVIDHHQMSDVVNCDILLHNELLEKDYSYLSAGGLVYLLAEKMKVADDGIRVLAMLALIGDVMELKGINPFIIRQGLDIVNRGGYYNISALCPNLNLPVNEEDIGFRFTPVINAAGRLPDYLNPNNMVRYFLCDDKKQIDVFAAKCLAINDTRKQMTSEHIRLASQLMDDSRQYILVKSAQFHEGLVGIAAARLAEDSRKMAIVLSERDGVLKGSGRCRDNDDIMAVLDGFKEHFSHFGGHKQACGMSMGSEQFEPLKQYLDSYYVSSRLEETSEYVMLENEDLTRENLEELFRYRPFGQGRKLPLFALDSDRVCEYRMLKTDHQLKWTVFINGMYISILSFENEGYEYYINRKLRFIGKLQENIFNGRKNFQIICENIDILQ